MCQEDFILKFGICLDGVEDKFETALRDRAKARKPFVYLEIGVAYCETWLAVCTILGETDADWRTIGIDPWQYAFEAYMKRLKGVVPDGRALMLVRTREEAFKTEMKRIGHRLDFVFIDGCHAKPCAIGDFLAVEPLVVSGGLVVFHDFGVESVDFQPHCQQNCDVIGATKELGLFDESRPGWKKLPDWVGDKAKNGATCGVFEKV